MFQQPPQHLFPTASTMDYVFPDYSVIPYSFSQGSPGHSQGSNDSRSPPSCPSSTPDSLTPLSSPWSALSLPVVSSSHPLPPCPCHNSCQLLSPLISAREVDESYRESFVPTVLYGGPTTKFKHKGRVPITFIPAFTQKRLLNSDGVSMVHCLARVGLIDSDTPLFGSLVEKGKKKITFALTWPGYDHVDWRVEIPIVRPSGALITRGELALALAKQFQEFAHQCDVAPYIPTSDVWRVGSQGFCFCKMKLAMMWNVGGDGDIWQASVRVQTS